ncbi:gap-Pol polyprotein, partial [Clonorchis sinensis]
GFVKLAFPKLELVAPGVAQPHMERSTSTARILQPQIPYHRWCEGGHRMFHICTKLDASDFIRVHLLYTGFYIFKFQGGHRMFHICTKLDASDFIRVHLLYTGFYIFKFQERLSERLRSRSGREQLRVFYRTGYGSACRYSPDILRFSDSAVTDVTCHAQNHRRWAKHPCYWKGGGYTNAPWYVGHEWAAYNLGPTLYTKLGKQRDSTIRTEIGRPRNIRIESSIGKPYQFCDSGERAPEILRRFFVIFTTVRQTVSQLPNLLYAIRGPREMDWAAAKEAFAAEFDTMADHQEAMRRFKTARMAPGCDPTVLSASLQQSLDWALPGLNGASRHQLLSDQFVEEEQTGFNSGGPEEESGSTCRTACSHRDGIAEAPSNEPMLQGWNAWPLREAVPSYPTICAQ